ncbi:MAG: hypothetical protein IJS61_00145 [Firmicutes bacterium]|nr:hypothetical protein [Bacillota bacterium]
MFKSFIYEEDGMGTIEIAILIAVLVALAIVFRKQLASLWNSISGKNEQVVNNAYQGDDTLGKEMQGGSGT